MLTIIIVSFNTKDFTLAAIHSVIDQAEDQNYRIIVVDNASTDGSADAIAAAFPQVDLLRSEENLGFAKANNLAALKAGGDYLLLLNPDTLVLDHGIDRLMRFAKASPAAGIWGGRTFFPDGAINPTSCFRFMSLWSIFAHAVGLTHLFPLSDFFHREGYGGRDRDSARQVEIVCGCFFLITTALWNRLGGFDPAFFIYAEEADLCFRARREGARPMVTPDAKIIHYGGLSQPVRADRIVRLYKAKIQFLRKHWPKVSCLAGVFFFELDVFIRKFAFEGLSALGRDGRWQGPAAEWASVWSRRGEWI